MKRLLIIPFLIFTSIYLLAQNPKYEFRGVWVSTVANIDWPSKTGLTNEQLKSEAISILDKQKSLGTNAIILQIRPTSDAIYPSELEPWSRYLSGKQGLAPEQGFDPLQFWIEEAHKRAMELHAWFNPYRIQQNIKYELTENHIFKQNPDWGWVYGSRSYFEPGNPKVWDFISKVVTDVVARYDVDAIHFDDYFYPYQVNNEEFPDSIAFKNFGGNFYPDKLHAWRRHNVDTIIQILSSAIKNEKPWVKFGISPFGVWRNRSQDIFGSETSAGTTNYDALYADIIKWQQNGWIDYTMPQLYWRDDHPAANFTTLAYWWSDFSYGRSIYLGLAPYRIDKKSEHKLWRKPKHFLNQIELLRKIEGIDGFGYFSSKHFFRDDFGRLNKKLQNKLCATPAIVPAMPWIDKQAPLPPVNLTLNGTTLTWNANEAFNEFDKARFFVVYYFPKNQTKQVKDGRYIIYSTGELKYTFDKLPSGGVIRVSSLDRLNNESPLSDPIVLP
jgi:uncharacterized lipoprotein YddW (UPF0748 family)